MKYVKEKRNVQHLMENPKEQYRAYRSNAFQNPFFKKKTKKKGKEISIYVFGQ